MSTIINNLPSVSDVLNNIKSLSSDVNCQTEEKELEESTTSLRSLKEQKAVSKKSKSEYESTEKSKAKVVVDGPKEKEAETQTDFDRDSDYDPLEDEETRIKDLAEDEKELAGDTVLREESHLTAEQLEREIYSDEFEATWKEAIEGVLERGKRDRELVLNKAADAFELETGEKVTEQMLSNAWKGFGIESNLSTDLSGEELEVFNTGDAADAEAFFREYQEALAVVRERARLDQVLLVNTICGISVGLTGTEPDAQQMAGIFGRIKKKFAEEARDEYLEENEWELESEDDVESDEESVEEVAGGYNSADDEDYAPEKDEFDYSQDIDDEDEYCSDV